MEGNRITVTGREGTALDWSRELSLGRSHREPLLIPLSSALFRSLGKVGGGRGTNGFVVLWGVAENIRTEITLELTR